ncbi:MAG: hypothetical protein LBT36_05325 [Oscillospiraceae bacterium]|jgi:hypothetical protein|nr:hypothetical protein [Oscillospiraceae bacterium]
MLCCVVAAAFIVRYLFRMKLLSRYLGFSREIKTSAYGWREYCELDVPVN